MSPTSACLPGTGSISRRIPQDAFHRQIMTEFNCREFVPVPLLSLHLKEVCV